MSQHRVIWGIAAIAVSCAVAVGLWRYRADIWSGTAQGHDQRLAHVLNLLGQDPAQLQDATREAIRAVAVDVVTRDRQSAAGCLVLGLQLQRERNFDDAEEYFRRAMSLRPDWAWPHMALGGMLAMQTRTRQAEAEAELRRAIALEPGWGRPHDTLAVLLRLEGRDTEAEDAARRALALDPNSIPAINNMANLLIEQGRYAEAEEYYRRAITLDPRQTKPFYNLACLYSLMGRTQEAVEALDDAITRDGIMRHEAANDPDLAAIRETPEFQRLVYGKEAEHEG